MNENSPIFINNCINMITSTGKDNSFYDRQNERISNKNINIINEQELLNQMYLTNPDDEIQREEIYEKIKSFYSEKSILNYPDFDQVINNIFYMMMVGSNSSIIFGLKCFFAIYCQNTYSFEYKFAESIIVSIIDHLSSDDQLIIQYTLQIIAKISGLSKKFAKLVYKHIKIYNLAQIIQHEAFSDDVKDKALSILSNYCLKFCTIPVELIDIVCQIAIFIFQNSQIGNLHQSIIYSCSLIAEKVSNFPDFFLKYSLFQPLNEILIRAHSAHTRSYILKIAHNLYKNPMNLDKIDINIVYGLMKHSIAAIQIAAIQCISEVIRSNKEIADTLIKKDIFSIISSILEIGSHKSKLCCIELLFLLYQTNPVEMTQTFIKNGYIETLIYMIQVTSGTSKSLKIILMTLTEINRTMIRIGKGKDFEEIFENAGAPDQLFELIDLDNDDDNNVEYNNVSNLIKTLLSEIES